MKNIYSDSKADVPKKLSPTKTEPIVCDQYNHVLVSVDQTCPPISMEQSMFCTPSQRVALKKI